MEKEISSETLMQRIRKFNKTKLCRKQSKKFKGYGWLNCRYYTGITLMLSFLQKMYIFFMKTTEIFATNDEC